MGAGATQETGLLGAASLGPAGLALWVHAGVDGLVAHAEEINHLNVYPVADADTGTNMLFTLRSAVAALRGTPRPRGVADVAAALARGAADGARGNSGLILSQILRGLADTTAEVPADTVAAPALGPTLFAAALQRGAERAVAALGARVPGTIVSVLEAAGASARTEATKGASLAAVASSAADAAALALDRTTSELDVLAEAGVVDAGGRGLLVLLDALVGLLDGRAPVRRRHRPAAPDAPAAVEPTPTAGAGHAVAGGPRYEVMYTVVGCAAETAAGLRERLSALGDSIVVAEAGVGELSVHVHADDAGAAVEAGVAWGTPRGIRITTLGAAGVERDRWGAGRAVLALVDGEGAAALFAAEGAHLLRCDDAAPDAAALVRATVDSGCAQLMVLPNGLLAAEELVAGCAAAAACGVDVVPLPTASMVQGLAALAVHDAARPSVDDGYAMARAVTGTRHAAVRIATERALTSAGACEPGDALGLARDEVLAVRGSLAGAAQEVIDILLAAGGGELVTVLFGAQALDGSPEAVATLEADLADHVRRHHLGTELLVYRTGHRGDALLIGIE